MDTDNIYINQPEYSEEPESESYQVIISGITWNPNSIRSYHNKRDYEGELPTQFTLDLPENKLNEALKAEKKDGEQGFKDVIETFCYDFLTRKFCHEVYSCSIWLPLEDND